MYKVHDIIIKNNYGDHVGQLLPDTQKISSIGNL